MLNFLINKTFSVIVFTVAIHVGLLSAGYASARDVYVPKEVTSAYPLPPYAFPRSKIHTAIIRTEKSALKGILPDGMQPIPGFEDYMSVSINRFSAPSNNIDPYIEAIFSVPVKLKTKIGEVIGTYSVQLYLGSTNPESSVSPTMAGQFVYGMPKREGEFTVSGDLANNTVVRLERDGNLLMEAEINKKDYAPDPEGIKLPPIGTHMNLKAIPKVDGSGWEVLQITGAEIGAKEDCIAPKLHESKSFDIKFDNNRIVLDSGRVIPVKEVLYTSFVDQDWCLSWRGVIHDYLVN